MKRVKNLVLSLFKTPTQKIFRKQEIEIPLSAALIKPTLKEQKEMYPWRKEYQGLDFSGDDIPETTIVEKGGPRTLSEILLPGLEKSNDKKTTWKKFRAICALLVRAHFNPDKLRKGNKIRLEDKVLYLELTDKTKNPKLALKLGEGGKIAAEFKEIKPEEKK